MKRANYFYAIKRPSFPRIEVKRQVRRSWEVRYDVNERALPGLIATVIGDSVCPGIILAVMQDCCEENAAAFDHILEKIVFWRPAGRTKKGAS